MALKTNLELPDEISSVHTSSKKLSSPVECEIAVPEKNVPRFESLPAEIRNMIYKFLLPPAELEETFGNRLQILEHPDWPQFHVANVLHVANTAILRANRNINREASAVLYRDTLLVSIDWNTYDRYYLRVLKIPWDVAFNIVPLGAPLPPCVVGIKQQYHGDDERTATTSVIIAAADFPAICRQLFRPYQVPRYHLCGARTSYSVISLPKIGYSEEKLRELIWSPLLALREARWQDLLGRRRRNLRLIDCTGVFEPTAASLDWDSESDDGEESMKVGYYCDDSKSNDDGSEAESSGDEDSEGGNSDEEIRGENGSDGNESGNEEDSDDEGDDRIADGGDAIDEIASDEDHSKDLGGEMSSGAYTTTGHDGDGKAQIGRKHGSSRAL